MKIKEMIEAYRSGALSKKELLSELPDTLHSLFEVADIMKTCNMSWEIGKEGVISRIDLPSHDLIGTKQLRLWLDATEGSQIPLGCLVTGTITELEEFQIFFHLLGKNGVLVDIGANVGWYSMLAALIGARSYAFEPIPRTYERLCKNISLNGFSTISTFQMGLGEKQAQETFYYHPKVSGASSRANLDYFGDNGARPVICEIDTLDAVCGRENISGISLIKCDVEGGELLVFRGARQTIQKYRPFVLTEMLRKWSAKFGYYPNEIIELFAQLNYRCVALVKDSPGKGYIIKEMLETTEETNFLFAPEEKLPDVSRFMQIVS